MRYVIVTKDLDRVVVESYGTAGYLTSGSFGHITEVKPKVFNKKPFWSMLFTYNGFVVEYDHFKGLMNAGGVAVL